MHSFWFFALGAALLLAGCGPNSTQSPEAGRPLRIVCTTGMVADALQQIAGDSAQVSALMGPGVDPHLYKATQGDLQKLNTADMVFYNGLHLEGKMAEVLQKLGRKKPVVALADALPPARLLAADSLSGLHDPHVWFDVSLWRSAVEVAAQRLAQADTARAAYYQARALRYLARLDSLHAAVQQQLAPVPPAQRMLITSHDAFAYFGRAYQFEVRGLQGISTVTEFGLKDITDLVNFIVQRRIKAIFVETSVSPKSIEAVVEGCRRKGHDVKVGGSLYSDAMGAPGTPEGNYVGMVAANVRTIAAALQ